MDPQKDFKTIIGDALAIKNLSHSKLAQLTNIPERYILALQHIDIEKLPAAPYIRGYLKKIAGVLNLNYEEIWNLYEKELAHKTSGAFDTLPANRFVFRSLNKRVVILGVFILIFAFYILLNSGSIWGTPPLEITNPKAPTIAVFDPSISLEGIINPKDKLSINDEEVLSDESGKFIFLFNLQPGLNTVKFKVKRFLGKEVAITRQILYQPQEELIINN